MAKSLDLIKVKLWFAGLQRLMFWFTTIFFVYLMLCYKLLFFDFVYCDKSNLRSILCYIKR